MGATFTNRPAVMAPVPTPFTADRQVDAARLATFCKDLLARGTDGVALYGTTGESASLTAGERMATHEALVSSGVPAESILLGCGTCAIPEAVELARHSLEMESPGVLMLPPFYFREPSTASLLDTYSMFIDGVADDRLRVYLYHFPAMSGMPFTIEVIGKLLEAYPDTIVGIKDSEMRWEFTRQILESFPDLAVYSGTEIDMVRLLRAGGYGCISSTVNVNSEAVRELADNWQSPDAEQLQEKVTAFREVFDKYPMLPAVKSYIAEKSGDPQWRTMRPPFGPLAAEEVKTLVDETAPFAGWNI